MEPAALLVVGGDVVTMSPRREVVTGATIAVAEGQVEYKAAWRGVRVVVADRWFPSSKTCSGCGAVKAKLRLSGRTYRCDQCGLVLDRGLNAASNLAALANQVAVGTSSPSCGATQDEPAGNPGKTSPVSATGTATGRPTPVGQRRHRKAPTQEPCNHRLTHISTHS